MSTLVVELAAEVIVILRGMLLLDTRAIPEAKTMRSLRHLFYKTVRYADHALGLRNTSRRHGR